MVNTEGRKRGSWCQGQALQKISRRFLQESVKARIHQLFVFLSIFFSSSDIHLKIPACSFTAGEHFSSSQAAIIKPVLSWFSCFPLLAQKVTTDRLSHALNWNFFQLLRVVTQFRRQIVTKYQMAVKQPMNSPLMSYCFWAHWTELRFPRIFVRPSQRTSHWIITKHLNKTITCW